MDTRFFATLAAATFSLSLVSAAAAADFESWDENRDGQIEATEFNNDLRDRGVFTNWDADEDGVLSEDEFNEGVYGYYDEDDDGLFSENEYDRWSEEEDEGFWDI